jgi:hypothetical protein
MNSAIVACCNIGLVAFPVVTDSDYIVFLWDTVEQSYSRLLYYRIGDVSYSKTRRSYSRL